MRDLKIWLGGVVVVGLGVAVLWGHRAGRLPATDSYEGDPIFGQETSKTAEARGWRPPPPIGSDPDYQGPSPRAPMRFSPYAMSTSRSVRRRTRPRREQPRAFLAAVQAQLGDEQALVAYPGDNVPRSLNSLGDRLRAVALPTWTGTDDGETARALQEQGFTHVIASRRVPSPDPWLQDDLASVLMRLRDGLSLAHFHPRLLTQTFALYRIAPPMRFSAEERQQLTTWLRATMAGESPPALELERPTTSVGHEEHRAIVSLRSRQRTGLLGRRLATASATGPTVLEALGRTARQLRQQWPTVRREVAEEYNEELAEAWTTALGEMELEVEIVDRMCQILERRSRRLVWHVELGLEGLYFQRGDRFSFMSPVTPIQRASGRNFRGERTTLETFLEGNGLTQELWEEEAEEVGAFGAYAHEFGRFETHHWLEARPGAEVIALYRNIPLVTIEQVTRDNLVRSLRLGAMWLVNNQLDDGQFRYRYKPLERPASRRWIEGNNIVRHALNPYTLLLVNRVSADERLVEAARRGLAYTLEHLRREGNRCYVWHRDVPAPYENAKMGTVAVTILSILAMADAMDIGEYADVLSCLGEELLYMQDPNGHFRQYDVPEDHAYYGCENTIFPGEMQLALAQLYGHTQDARYREAFARAFDWYRQWWAINEAKRTRDGIYNEEDRMNLVGFVPWNVMALNEMHRHTEEERYADFAFELQDWVDDTFLYDAARSPYPDYLGSYFKHHYELPAINSSGYSEGAAAAYALALRTGRDVERRRQTLLMGARFALQIQFEGYATTYYLPDAETAMGGYRYTLNFSRSRNDYSYHAMSALAQAVEFLREQDYPNERPVPLPLTLTGSTIP
jgi:hypothetical protein